MIIMPKLQSIPFPFTAGMSQDQAQAEISKYKLKNMNLYFDWLSAMDTYMRKIGEQQAQKAMQEQKKNEPTKHDKSFRDKDGLKRSGSYRTNNNFKSQNDLDTQIEKLRGTLNMTLEQKQLVERRSASLSVSKAEAKPQWKAIIFKHQTTVASKPTPATAKPAVALPAPAPAPARSK